MVKRKLCGSSVGFARLPPSIVGPFRTAAANSSRAVVPGFAPFLTDERAERAASAECDHRQAEHEEVHGRGFSDGQT